MASANSRPNLLVVVMDSVRADRLSGYGYPKPTSPHLDGIAQDGVCFTSAISECNWTLPVAVTLLTGLTPREHRAESHRRLPEGMPSLIELLGEAGYKTYGGSASGFLGPRWGLCRGFDQFTMPARHGHLTRYLSRYVLRPMGWTDEGGTNLIRGFVNWAAKTTGPWFGLLWFIEAHYPYLSPQPYLNRFTDPPVPYNRRRRLSDRMRFPFNFISTASEDELRDLRGLYEGSICYGDALLGQLRDSLSQHGLWDDTTSVIMADHGDMLGERGLIGHGSCSSVYQPLIRIPMVVHSPHVTPGTVSPSLVQVSDITQTVSELAGVAERLPASAAPRVNLFAASRGQGRAAALCEREPLIERRYQRERRHAPHFDFTPHRCHESAAISDGWKLIARSDGRDELYHLETDPEESIDRFHDEPERVATLRRVMEDLQGRAKPHSSTDGLAPDEEAIVEKRLQDLGYL